MEILLIKLFLGHVIGDFILQPDKWVKDKEKRKLGSPYFYLHMLIHGILLLLLLSIWDYRWVIISITLIHGIIDAIKLLFQSDSNRRGWFFADQVMHVVSILGIWYVFAKPDIDFTFLNDEGFLLKALAVLFITFPSAVIIRIIINKWNPEITSSRTLPLSQTGNSLQSAGKYIGVI